jgi:peptidyl-dipeptidase A
MRSERAERDCYEAESGGDAEKRDIHGSTQRLTNGGVKPTKARFTNGVKTPSVSAMNALPRIVSLAAIFVALVVAARASESPIQERADRFLSLANAGYKALSTVNQEAQWLAVTDVSPEHDAASEAAGKAAAAFNGNPALIKEAQDLLTHTTELNDITVRQLKQLLLNAAEGPMTNPDLVKQRVEAETKQASILNGFEFKLNGQPITAK